MKKQPLLRVVFRENVNFPSKDPKAPAIPDGIDNIFPRKGAIGDTSRAPYRAYFCEGFVMLENTTSKNVMRYPMSLVREMTFEEDHVEQLRALAEASKLKSA